MSEKVTRAVGKAKLSAKKHSPEILLAAGLITGAATIFFACKGTLKAKKIIDDHKEAMDNIHEAIEVADPGEYTEQDAKKDTVTVYAKTAGAFLKEYWPAIACGAISVTCILTSHGIMKKRNIALATSLLGVRTAFDEYRHRVANELGDKMDEHFLYATETKEIEHEVTDEKGKTKTVKEKVEVSTKPTVYSRFFDECNPNWTRDGGANYLFTRSQMLYLQHKLRADGYLFLNDVYKVLDMPITVAGQSAGWIYDYDNPDTTMIYFKGFGGVNALEERLSDEVRAFRNGYERSVLIDFGNIRDDILTDLPRVDSQVEQI